MLATAAQAAAEKAAEKEATETEAEAAQVCVVNHSPKKSCCCLCGWLDPGDSRGMGKGVVLLWGELSCRWILCEITGKLTNDAQAKKCASMVKCFERKRGRGEDKYAAKRARSKVARGSEGCGVWGGE